MRKLNAYFVYLFFRGGSALLFSLIVTYDMVYQVRTVGLNPLQLVLVGTTLELAALLFEIPTGVVADVYSRRLSVVIGTALIGLGFIVEGSFPLFGMVLVAQVIWGIGYTFISGAGDAWIADEIGPDRAGAAFLRGSQIGQGAALIGIILSAPLAAVSLQLPIVLGGALYIMLAGVLWLIMPEDGFQPTPPDERDTWLEMRTTLVEGVRLVRTRPALGRVLLISLVYGLYSEGWDRLWTAFMLNNVTFPALGQFDPLTWFAIFSAAAMLLSIAATEIARRRLDLTSQRSVTGALSILYGLVALGIIGFALSRSFAVAAGAYLLVQVLRETSAPIFTAWSNQHIDSNVRATVLSMSAQTNEFGQIAGGPVVGLIGTMFSLRAALTVSGLIFTPAVALLRDIRGTTENK